MSPTPTGVRLTIQVKPRASKPGIAGVVNGMLVVRVGAPPVDGAANAEVIAVLARALDVPRRAISVAVGERSTRKQVDVTGRTKADVERLLASL